MRTTLDIDDDALALAREEAERRHTSVDAAVSMLIRYASAAPVEFEINPISGVPMLPRRRGAGPVTLEMINALRDEEDEAYFK